MKPAKTVKPALMNEREAQEYVSQIKSTYLNATQEIGQRLLELRDREGWRALGYSSFKECMTTEFAEMNYSPQQIYKLVDAEQIRCETDADLKDAHALALKNVEPETRPMILNKAKELAATSISGKMTTAHIEEAKRLSVASEPASSTAEELDHSGGGQKAKSRMEDREYAEALQKLRAALGRALAEAIESNVLPHVDRTGVILWSQQESDLLPRIERLVAGGNRWTVKKALHFLAEMPTGKHKIEKLCWLAMANADGKWEGTIDAVHFELQAPRKTARKL